MLSISHAPAQLPPIPHVAARQPARGATAAARDPHDLHRDVADFCARVSATLRDGGAIEGPMRAAVLALTTHLLQWPRGLPIRLHTEGDESGRRYAPPTLGAREYVEPLHVKHCADGRFGSFTWDEPLANRWVDFGAHPDSLFEAVLDALRTRDGVEHGAFTRALRRDPAVRNTDAHWLRLGLLDMVEHSPQASGILQPLVYARDRADEQAPVNADLLLELVPLAETCVRPLGLKEVARRYNVSANSLQECMLSDGRLRPRGDELVLRKADPSFWTGPINARILGEIVEMDVDGVEARGGLEAVAREYHVAVVQLRRYFHPVTGVTAKGDRMLAAAGHPAARRTTAAAPNAGSARPVAPPSRDGASAPGRATFAPQRGHALHDTQGPAARLGAAVGATLRGGGAIGGPMRAATLASMTRLPDWPRHLSVRLHTEGDDTGRRYDPDANGAPRERVDPIRVRHRADGHYVAFRWVGAQEHWTDCGARADSLFGAVLEGMRLRDKDGHAAFVAALAQDRSVGVPAALQLRNAVADLVAGNGQDVIAALKPLAAAGDRANRKGKIDGPFLREMFALGGACIRAFGLVTMGERHNVCGNTLVECMTADAIPRTRGIHILKTEASQSRPNRIDTGLLQELHRQGPEGVMEWGGIAAFADAHQVSLPQLLRLFDPLVGLNEKGLKRMRKGMGHPETGSTATPSASPMPAALSAPERPQHLMDIPFDDLVGDRPEPPSSEHTAAMGEFPDDLMDIAFDDLIGFPAEPPAVPPKRARWGP